MSDLSINGPPCTPKAHRDPRCWAEAAYLGGTPVAWVCKSCGEVTTERPRKERDV